MPALKNDNFLPWYVDRARKNNTKSKILHKDKRNEVYKILRTVIQVRNVAVFDESLLKALHKFNSDPDLL